jgi:hypothetical protein
VRAIVDAGHQHSVQASGRRRKCDEGPHRSTPPSPLRAGAARFAGAGAPARCSKARSDFVIEQTLGLKPYPERTLNDIAV